ncbi:MAG: nitrous oxide reductase family maturation protein NosD [Alphaproteobacteria bacterium]|nr:nitrous oxide reductase family maturation protein NosD [Alphaproteobacteria bacterium]
MPSDFAHSADATRKFASNTLQKLIDQAPEGSTVNVPPGHYLGSVAVLKSIQLDGGGLVTIDAEGKGSVIVIKADNASVRNLRLINSGVDHNNEDAGIKLRGNGNTIKDNIIEDALFGICLEQSEQNILRRNKISSKAIELGMRGDSIKLWNSHHNLIEDNEIINSRDLVLWFSRENKLTGNSASRGRYGLHFMQAGNNLVENNRFFDNSVGLALMYSQGDVLRRNYIASSTGATGVCVSVKESSNVTIEDNDILYCANGIHLDQSPIEPGTINKISKNRISYNDIAISFLSNWHDNEFRLNRLTGNLTEVAVYGSGTASKNVWDGNIWETYEGFDRNGDGIGDTPQRILSYAGRVWMDVPNTRFFKGSFVLELLDFLDRLAPFSEPRLLLEDPHPRLSSAGKPVS